MKGTNLGKDVIYVDIDDEITAIIDKVRGSRQKIVALVLPKRAAVLQSIVNMKLLRRSSDEAKKHIVLITSEAGLLPLAGTVGVHVARTLQSKPEVPLAPVKEDERAETVQEPSGGDEPEEVLDTSVSVGALSGALPGAATAPNEDLDDTIELDNEPDGDSNNDGKLRTAVATGKAPKDKHKFKVPNFNKFRILLFVGALVIVLLIGGAAVAMKALPKASVTIRTDSTALNSTVPLALRTAEDTVLDVEKGVIAATLQQTQKTQSEQMPATGQQNNGEKAAGTVDMTAKDCTAPYAVTSVAAGTGVTANGKTYITDAKADFSPTTFDFSTSCWSYKASGVAMTAQAGGAAFNVAAGTFTVAGRSDVAATGSASGGTDDIIKIVTQGDIDAAKQKIGGADTEQLHNDLKSGLIAKSMYAIDQTFKSSEAETKLSANPGDKADVVTVTQTITYTMMGVKRDELERVAANAAKQKIDAKKQSILEYGFDDAEFEVKSQDPKGAEVVMQTTIIAGPELSVDKIKQQVAGKKAGDAAEAIKANPGVTDVDVRYSPFWVSRIPGDVEKITVTIVKPTVKADASSDAP